MKIRSEDFETTQNMEKEERKKHIQTILDPSGVGLKSNVDITLDDWMKRELDIANQLTFPDSVKQYVNEIMRTINKSINNFNEIDDSPTIINDDNNKSQDIYIEDDYVNDEVDFVGERNQPTNSVEITNINDT